MLTKLGARYRTESTDQHLFFRKQEKELVISKKPLRVEIAFTTENIKTDFKKAIEAGATEFEPLVEKPWGQKVGYVLDNNGFLIEICTPIKN